MNKSDLKAFFAKEVSGYQPGDATVSKFVGQPYVEGVGVEALLDVEFIMGMAPGVQTEFYDILGGVFCVDLVTYTSMLLTDDEVPLMHSISYGWQGAFSDVGCSQADADTIDINFAKLALKGVSVIVASGDSGSGYETTCDATQYLKGVQVMEGSVLRTTDADLRSCCLESRGHARGWTWHPPPDTRALRAMKHARRVL